jgi:tetratricopeptide (TPR) repeat protein
MSGPRPLLALLVLAALADAGGGPETTLVVVHTRSPASRRIANEYVALRGVPDANVLHLDGVPTLRILPYDAFRERILLPVLAAIRERGLAIDTVAYSADFPFGVDLAAGLDASVPREITRVGSLTGLTYFARRLEAGGLRAAVALDANRYFRRDLARPQRRSAPPPSAEDLALHGRAVEALGSRRWKEAAELYAEFVRRYPHHPESFYNLACCLARLERGDEAVARLREAIEAGFADGAHMARDEDLASLRGRADFQALLDALQPGPARVQRAHGFSSRYAWTGAEDPVEDEASLDRYLLAVQLAYTGEWGNSVPEALAYLRSAAGSDGARPSGTFYFCANGDVRSTTREGAFAAAIEALRRRGKRAERLDASVPGQTGVLPIGRDDVAGAVIGAASFDWASSKSRILPGAIVEHLTSFGAAFDHGGQTKLSELLRHGAAGASGTVTEPFAIQAKFPHPFVHVHYADGCSLAEAFYQSVAGPYQLLIVGDPLARPHATFAKIEVAWPAGPVSGEVALHAAVEPQPGRVELFVDGRPIGPATTFDAGAFDAGAHDVRVVAVEAGRVETRSFAAAIVEFGRRVEARGPERVVYGAPIALKAAASGATAFEVWHQGRRVDDAGEGGGGLEVASDRVGPGPVELRVRARFADGKSAWSAPVRVFVADPAPLPAIATTTRSLPGLRGVDLAEGGARRPIAFASLDQVPAGRRVALAGEMEAPRDGAYQLVVAGFGTLSLSVGGVKVFDRTELRGLDFALVGLAAGWHPIALEHEGPLSLLLGYEQVARPPRLRHAIRPAPAQAPRVAGALAELFDGKRSGPGVRMPAEGVEIPFAKPVKNLAGLVLVPAPATKDDPPVPQAWVVEVPAPGGKWRPVPEVTALATPDFVELSFKPLSAAKVRLRPSAPATPLLLEIELLSKS